MSDGSLTDEYDLDYFEEHGFTRKECTECSDMFWTRDAARTTCGEPPCDTYAFIDDPGFDDSYTLEGMREAFLSFFEEHGHERIDSYPVAANRWRDDVLLTQASIYDFQPLVTSGQTPPPANPLAVSQPSIRMQDIENVGKTGRHTMAFEMMGHHAFNAKDGADAAYDGEVYWKEETVAYCDNFFQSLGADMDDITYIEDPWVGGGNAGPAFEVIYKGAELATLVFMSLEEDEAGDHEMKDGNTYSEMDTYVVDTGYGLERWTWVSQGTPTVYEAIYPDFIDRLKTDAGLSYTQQEEQLIHEAAKRAGKLDIDDVDDVEAAREQIANDLGVDSDHLRELMEPLETVYAIADHTRTLAYMLGDEIVPSNTGTGYLVRRVIRRTQRFLESLDVADGIDELVVEQADRLGYENQSFITDVLQSEVSLYETTREEGHNRVQRIVEEHDEAGEAIDEETVVDIYMSHGLQPSTVVGIADEVGVPVNVPDNLRERARQRHAEDEQTEEQRGDALDATAYKNTELQYYNDQQQMACDATVLGTQTVNGQHWVVVDRTVFYPEGGGQPADHGEIIVDNTTLPVTDVQRRGDVVFHAVGEGLDEGVEVRCRVDESRRLELMKNHTATHIVGRAARAVLGDHVRQAGARKGVDVSRLDIRHFEDVDDDALRAIERRANELVQQDIRVGIERRHRNDVEDEYGFDIYQGGIPPGADIRVVTVDDDVQACGGTHVRRTGEIGLIKLVGATNVQDGVIRLRFCAGESAVERTRRVEQLLDETAAVFSVEQEDAPAIAEQFFEEWKEQQDTIDELKQRLAEARTQSLAVEEREVDGLSVVTQRLDADEAEIRETAKSLDADVCVVAGADNGSATVVVTSPAESVDARVMARDLAGIIGGGGGGSNPSFGRGGGSDVGAIDELLDAVPDAVRAATQN